MDKYLYLFILGGGRLIKSMERLLPAGRRFSIGFDSQQLRILAEQQEFVLSQCEYSSIVQRELIASSINAEIQQSSITDLQYLSERMAALLLHHCAEMKDSSFAEEREWRLISEVTVDNHNPNFCFRKGQSVIVPYFKFKLADCDNQLPIKDIVCDTESMARSG